jgi:hypothetical protein
VTDEDSNIASFKPLPSQQLAELQFYVGQFQQIADQRLRLFNFYFILFAAVSSVTANLWSEGENEPAVFLVLGFMHIVLPLGFFLVDLRNQQLINRRLTPIILLEEEWVHPAMRVFSTEATVGHKTAEKPWYRRWVSGSSVLRISVLYPLFCFFHICAGSLIVARGFPNP